MLKKVFTAYLLLFSLYFPAGVLAETSKEEKIPLEIEKLRNLRQSQINIYKNGFNIKVKLYLFAEDEKVEIQEGDYCGGADGDKIYTGNYQLISVKDNKIVSRIDLGKDYEFIENKLHSGLQLFVMPKTLEQLIIIYQYVSCSIEGVEFFRIDEKGNIYKINFFDKDGTVGTAQSISGGNINESDGNLIFCRYDNAIGHLLCDDYTYNGKDFIQTASWMTQDLTGKKNTDGEARRVLLEYLAALLQRKYEKAVLYYGGKYDFLLKLNPDVSIKNKPKLFERYCTKNGGKCGISSYFKNVTIESATMLKFTVELMKGNLDDIIISGKSDFEFRVKRINGEFKVMDLPPYAPN